MLRVVWASCILISLAAFGCGPKQEPDILAEVGTEKIRTVDLRRALADYGLENEKETEILESVLDELIDQTLIILQAKESGIAVSDRELEEAEAEIKKDYPGKSFDELLLSQAMDRQEWRFRLKRTILIEKVTASKINAQLKADPEVAQAAAAQKNDPGEDFIKVAQIMTNDKKTAQQAKRRLRKGIPFNKVAEEFSTLAGQAGQEVDYFAKGDMPPELEAVVWPLNVGQVSGIVKSPYGFHIFLVLDKRKGRELELKEEAESLRQARREELKAAWLMQLRTRTEIKKHRDRLQTVISGSN